MNHDPLKSMISQTIDDIKARHSKPAHPPSAPSAGITKEPTVKKPKPAPKHSKPAKKTVKRVGYFTMVGKALKNVKGEVSVKKLATQVQSKFPGRPFDYYTGIILQCGAWCKRKGIKCATLVRDHKPAIKATAKVEKAVTKKSSKKTEPSLKDLGL